jgi:hypothetical protein
MIGVRFAPNVPYAQKSYWTLLMELISDVGHVEPRFALVGCSVSVSAR